ncbi:hypothetical protein Chor_015002 [Crotalus horridus]
MQNVLMPWLQNSILNSDPSQDQLVRIRESLKSSRPKRDIAKCPEKKVITEKILNDDLIEKLVYYIPVELKLCLTKENLVNNISAFSDYPFIDEQLIAIFPEGYPPAVISNLGLLEKLIDKNNIKQWTINSSSTVQALLDIVPNDEMMYGANLPLFRSVGTVISGIPVYSQILEVAVLAHLEGI